MGGAPGAGVALYYPKDGKLVTDFDYVEDPKRRFRVACQRGVDNLGAGDKAYVRDERGRIYEVSRASRMAKPVEDPEIARVFGALSAGELGGEPLKDRRYAFWWAADDDSSVEYGPRFATLEEAEAWGKSNGKDRHEHGVKDWEKARQENRRKMDGMRKRKEARIAEARALLRRHGVRSAYGTPIDKKDKHRAFDVDLGFIPDSAAYHGPTSVATGNGGAQIPKPHWRRLVGARAPHGIDYEGLVMALAEDQLESLVGPKGMASLGERKDLRDMVASNWRHYKPGLDAYYEAMDPEDQEKFHWRVKGAGEMAGLCLCNHSLAQHPKGGPCEARKKRDGLPCPCKGFRMREPRIGGERAPGDVPASAEKYDAATGTWVRAAAPYQAPPMPVGPKFDPTTKFLPREGLYPGGAAPKARPGKDRKEPPVPATHPVKGAKPAERAKFGWDGGPEFEGYDLTPIAGPSAGGFESPGFEKSVADAIMAETLEGHKEDPSYKIWFDGAKDCYMAEDPDSEGPYDIGPSMEAETVDGPKKLYLMGDGGWTWMRDGDAEVKAALLAAAKDPAKAKALAWPEKGDELASARAWLHDAIGFMGGGWHPDDSADDMVNMETGERTFTAQEAKAFNRNLDRCHAAFDAAGEDIYEFGLTHPIFKEQAAG
jgi:hypothetical protein